MVLLLGVVSIIGFNDQVKFVCCAFYSKNCNYSRLLKMVIRAREELLESIRQYPGDEGSDENNLRKTMNSIQRRV